ncbi:MAG: HD domain-containing phosphohydrolase, partial [Thermoleophilia bacterium]
SVNKGAAMKRAGEGKGAGTGAPSPMDAAFWARAVEDSPQFIFVLDRERTIVAVSQALARGLGREPHDIVGRRCHELMHPQGVVPDECPLRELLVDEGCHHAEVHSDALGGDFFISVTPLPDAQSNVVGTLHTAYDITRRRRIETQLRESEARYRNVVENVPLGMFQSTPEDRLVYVNLAFATMFGYESPAEAIEDVNRRGIAETIYEDPARRQKVVRDVRAASGGWLVVESRYVRKDGSVFDAVEHFCARRELSSGAMFLFGFVQDVTEQQQAAKAAERSARLLSHGERLAHLGSWEWDLASGMNTVSEEWQRIHGLVGDRPSNDEITLTCHEDDREAVQAAVDEAAAGGLYRVDHRIVRPDSGEVRYLTTYGVPVLDAQGRLETVLGASLDVTERVQADQALRERESRLQSALGDTVAALGATVAMRDPYTAGHERRVAELACLIAERLGWTSLAIETVRTAGLVHDVGKIAVPAEILAKPALLTEVEFDLVKVHPQAAYDILAPIDFDAPIAEIVLQHHERLDGSGYPRGLTEAQILPEARVLAVADVAEAMISHRPHRAARPLAEAMAELADGAGTRYDDADCRLCRALFEEEGFTLPD